MDLTLFRQLNDLYRSAPALWDRFEGAPAVVVLALVVIAVAWVRKQARWLLPAALAVALTDLGTARVLKPLAGRERPCAVLEEVYGPAEPGGALRCGSGGAMPSVHAANTMALATVVGAPELAVLSVVVGGSRVVTGQHWPSDVLAGWVVGLLIGGAVRWGVARALGWA